MAITLLLISLAQLAVSIIELVRRNNAKKQFRHIRWNPQWIPPGWHSSRHERKPLSAFGRIGCGPL
jgi:hypothetical protein